MAYPPFPTYQIQRLTTDLVAGTATEMSVPNNASSMMLRPEGTDIRITFLGTDGAPIGTEYLQITQGQITTVPVKTSSVYVASAGVSITFAVLFT